MPPNEFTPLVKIGPKTATKLHLSTQNQAAPNANALSFFPPGLVAEARGEFNLSKAGQRVILSALPPSGLVLMAIAAVQLGAVLATQLFPVLGAEGTVAVRIIFSACLLTVVARNRLAAISRMFVPNWGGSARLRPVP